MQVKLSSNTGDRLPNLGIGYMPRIDPAEPEKPLFPVIVGTFTPLQGMTVDLSEIIWPSGNKELPSAAPTAYQSSSSLQVRVCFVGGETGRGTRGVRGLSDGVP